MKTFLEGLLVIWEMIREMAWQAVIVILIVLLFRMVIGKISKQAAYLLWAVVALRLLCPVMITSDFSVFNWMDGSRMQNMLSEQPSNMAGIETDIAVEDEQSTGNMAGIQPDNTDNLTANNTTNAGESASKIASDKTQFNPFVFARHFVIANWQAVLWLTGLAVMLGYGLVSVLRLKRRLKFATKAGDGIYESSVITSPFVFGIVNPIIYLPYHLNERERDYILRHEQYHVRRKDYLVKIVAFLLLAVYWFQPLVWVSFYLMSRDMEMSCDEQALNGMGNAERKAYSTLLLDFAREKRMPLPSPLAFGENDTKSRIKQILNYKKPTLWGLLLVLVLSVTAVFVCLTDAGKQNEAENPPLLEEGYDLADEEALETLAEQLYEAKNPYIGNASANGKLLGILWDTFGITGADGMELQTSQEPYWITVHFDKEPDELQMWKTAVAFLSLVENCEEFRWEFYNEEELLTTYYTRSEDAEAILECADIKAYAESADTIKNLLIELKVYRDASETNSSYNGNPTAFRVGENKVTLFADSAGMDWTARNTLENKLMRDGINYRSEMMEIRSVIYRDLDNSGTMDYVLFIDNQTELASTYSTHIYIYMNDDPVYEEQLSVTAYCWGMQSGDIDNDGNMEFLYIGDSGSTNGGLCYTGILKYDGSTLTPMELPGDFTDEQKANGITGYNMEVLFADGDGEYLVNCPALGKSQAMHSKYAVDESGEPVMEPKEGEIAGAGGYLDFSIIYENRRYYLRGIEYLFGEGGISHGIGYASFVFDWEGGAGWVVKEFEVFPYEGASD